ncbi:nucleotidyl transferase AbiEii/AbiGii toxin family protein [Candidatus Azambacteria bacterium]|nr:nucleotidyl transferase AbiEii/AbiGii toxin family protein [Candidatus Azambacteria bacterium]
MFYNILDKKRLDLLPLFKEFKKDFYLAGGTALALQIGHRDSIDFDFFSEQDINTKKLFEQLREIFKKHTLLNIQEELNTLTVLVDDFIKISFFTHKYHLIQERVDDDENLSLASIEDIACMKLLAITGRASNKDYIDLYFILKNLSLLNLLEKAYIKYPELERNLILKSLVYFEDITQEKILFKNNNDVDFEKIKEMLRNEVKKVQILPNPLDMK